MVGVMLKWSGQTFELDVDPTQPVPVLKAQIYTLTSVAPDRQKIMGFRGGLLKDDADLMACGLKQGMKLMLVGTAEGKELKPNVTPAVFTEDLTAEQRAGLLREKRLDPFPTGLINLGTTCYLNSVIQFLRPVDEFTDSVKKLSGQITSPDGHVRLCAALRELYTARDKTEDSLPPILIVEALRTCFPQFAETDRNTGGFMQQDAEECLSVLLETLNQQTAAQFVDKLFAFDCRVTLECLSHPEEPLVTKQERLRVLSCHVGTPLKPVDHLHQGVTLALRTNVSKVSEFTGQDAQYVKVIQIATVPEYLIIHLVRFEWKSASSMSRTSAGRTKVCRRVAFSPTLDIYELCSADLQQELQLGRRVQSTRLSAKESEKKADGELNSCKPSIAPIQQQEDKAYLSDGTFTLTSIVTHKGRAADEGHYVAWSRKDDEWWYKFDDSVVTEVKWKTIDLCGGRSDYHIATLLLYKQNKIVSTPSEIQAIKEKYQEESAPHISHAEEKSS